MSDCPGQSTSDLVAAMKRVGKQMTEGYTCNAPRKDERLQLFLLADECGKQANRLWEWWYEDLDDVELLKRIKSDAIAYGLARLAIDKYARHLAKQAVQNDQP